MSVGHLYVSFKKLTTQVLYLFPYQIICFWVWIVWVLHMFWKLTPCRMNHLQISPIDCFLFCWYRFPFCTKGFYFGLVLIGFFLFLFLFSVFWGFFLAQVSGTKHSSAQYNLQFVFILFLMVSYYINCLIRNIKAVTRATKEIWNPISCIVGTEQWFQMCNCELDSSCSERVQREETTSWENNELGDLKVKIHTTFSKMALKKSNTFRSMEIK